MFEKYFLKALYFNGAIIALSYPPILLFWWLIMKKRSWKLFRSPNPNPSGVGKCNSTLLTFVGRSVSMSKVSLFCISFQVIPAWFLTEYRPYCLLLNCWCLIVLCEECLVVWYYVCTSLVLVKKIWKILSEVFSKTSLTKKQFNNLM